jgi:hypothetical protein
MKLKYSFLGLLVICVLLLSALSLTGCDLLNDLINNEEKKPSTGKEELPPPVESGNSSGIMVDTGYDPVEYAEDLTGS